MVLRTCGSLLILSSAVATLACGSSASTASNVTAPASARCEATVSSSTVSFGPDGGAATLTIGIDRECAWRVSSPVNWITFTTAVEGQGDGSVGYRVSENRDPVSRQAQVSVADRQLALTQQPAPCRYELDGVPGSLAAEGGQSTIEIETHAVCEWSAASHTPWASLSPTSGRGNARVTLAVTANTGSEREAVVTIAGHRVEIPQRAVPAPVPVPQPPAPSPNPPTPPTPVPNPPTPTPTPTPTPPPPPGPTPVRSIELKGEARDVSGQCPAKTFRLENRIVYTTSETRYERGNCDHLRNRADIDKLQGTLMSDERVRANVIRFEKDDD